MTFAATDPGMPAGIDTAYHAKYDRYRAAIVGSVVGKNASKVTVRLLPRH